MLVKAVLYTLTGLSFKIHTRTVRLTSAEGRAQRSIVDDYEQVAINYL